MEKRKKIIFTVINDLNYDQRMIRICSALQQNGYDCCLIGRKKKNSLPLLSRNYKQYRLNCFFESGKFFYLEYNIRLFIYLLFQNPWSYCSIDVDTFPAVFLSSRIRGKNLIFDAHEIFTDVPEVKDRKFIKKIWQVIEKMAFKKSDLCYTVGGELAKYFSEKYNVNVHVVRNVPEKSNQIPYSPDKQNKFMLYQGALNKGRGLEAAIEAMQKLPCRLIIAGEGDLSEELRELASQYNVADKIDFLGFVLPENLPSLTCKAWIGLNVSENAGLSYYLSLNNKCFDYIRAGLPSLMNPFPEYNALNSQYNIGLPAYATAESIVENALLLLENNELHDTISKNCIIASEELNWEKESKLLLKLYQSNALKQ